ncbi:MAG: CvpA family protein [Alphaproteobacteria bacterium]|nr:CvpA family protein [Alphaproteobacteria bacterium]
MNNLDVFILIVVAISGLIALNRGLIKEVLSIIGWILSVVVIVMLLPVVQPFAEKYVESKGLAPLILSSLFILVVFFVIWIIITSQIIDKIRASKLSTIDRILGLFFGIIRACILIILFYIFSGWIIPHNEQPQLFKDSKYFQMAGDFAAPIAKLLPKNVEKSLSQNTKESKAQETEEPGLSEDMDALFEQLVQPKVENKKDEKEVKKSGNGYNPNEQKSMDRLIEISVE